MNNNTYIRTLYSPGFSFLMMSFFKTNLTLNFVPYLGKDVELVFPYSNNATLIFENKLDQDNQMGAYLLINKNNGTMNFRFGTMQYRVRENGQVITTVIQSGLGAFVKTLEAYLTRIGTDLHLNKLSEEDFDNQPNRMI